MFPRLKNQSFMGALMTIVVAYPIFIMSVLLIVVPTYIGLNLLTTFISFFTFNPAPLQHSLNAQKNALLYLKERFFFKITSMTIIGNLPQVEENIENIRYLPHEHVMVFVRFISSDIGAIGPVPIQQHCMAGFVSSEPFLMLVGTNNANVAHRLSKTSIRSIQCELKEKNIQLIGIRHLKTGEFYSVA